MREDPEQVLPQQRLAAPARLIEMRAELTVHPQQKEGKVDRRHREQVADRGRGRAPDHDRQAVDRHAGRTRPHHRDDEVGGADGGRDPEEDHSQGVQVHVRPWMNGRNE
jgi:hypothetical protein